MEMDFESWVHQRQPNRQFPNAKSMKLPSYLGMSKTGIPCATTPCTEAASTFGFPGAANFKAGQFKEPHGWFYGLPRFRQGLMQNSSHHNTFMPEIDFPGKVPAFANDSFGEANVSLTDVQPAPKQFLVFDRTGDKTTFMLSSMMGTTANQPLNSWNQKPSCCYNVSQGELGYGSSGQFHSEPNLTDELDYDNEIGEMHEDTEDINALLSSDDNEDDYSDEGEEASTGHSPSTMTAYENEDTDETASSTGSSKRQKIADRTSYDASSYKRRVSLEELEDDAESSCAGSWPVRRGSKCSLSGSKRERREKIRETVSILKTILPSGNGKDAVVVLDEAINYLKALKFKAKSLGISGQ